MKLVKNSLLVSIITFGFAQGFALWPYLIVKRNVNKDWEWSLINHEKIHLEQQKELWIIGFYILYIVWFLIELLFTWNFKKAYFKIPFETEAFSNQFDKDYLDTRRKFGWLNFM